MDDAPVALLDSEEEVLASKTSSVHKLATVISAIVEDGRTPIVRAVGVAAVNQAVKAIIQARGLTAQHGMDLVIVPGFDVADFDDGTSGTCIVLRVFRRDAEIPTVIDWEEIP